ncbi:uncharacterized protein [Spinacia oleracea]|uniref:RBR-type E3 ubiquitin transferase n=1 Tax=Spinacia oleracea TaxID=3562 RepID=A0ABM3RNM5_SPIOL|nr:uncharacterized protein LOC110794964 [Spinacia oleracea]
MRIQALFSPVIAFFKSRVSKNPKREKVISINNETFECLICMERKPIKTIFKPINKSSKKRKPNPKISCYHPFCVDCISKYIDAKVQDNISTIICPDVGCKKVIDFNCCVTIIPKPVLDRWEAVVSKSKIPSLYCPYKKCSAPIFLPEKWSKKTRTAKAKCPHCRKKICRKCKVAWHDGKICEEFKKLGVENEYDMTMKLIKNNCWQRCPQCRMYVGRTIGCNRIHCRCGCGFCYRCGLQLWTCRCYAIG